MEDLYLTGEEFCASMQILTSQFENLVLDNPEYSLLIKREKK
jgi:hypothetical protein